LWSASTTAVCVTGHFPFVSRFWDTFIGSSSLRVYGQKTIFDDASSGEQPEAALQSHDAAARGPGTQLSDSSLVLGQGHAGRAHTSVSSVCIFPDPSDFDRCCKLKDRLPSIVVEPTEGEVESGELRWPPEDFLVSEEDEEEAVVKSKAGLPAQNSKH
ncbi:hypothetical protein JZ751_004897, partial [Albula glossodonta]